MTRFARAKGSKASNERVPEEATPWNEMKKQLLEKKEEGQQLEKKRQADKQRQENYQAFLNEVEEEKTKSAKWAEFPQQSKRKESEKGAQKRKQNGNEGTETEVLKKKKKKKEKTLGKPEENEQAVDVRNKTQLDESPSSVEQPQKKKKKKKKKENGKEDPESPTAPKLQQNSKTRKMKEKPPKKPPQTEDELKKVEKKKEKKIRQIEKRKAFKPKQPERRKKPIDRMIINGIEVDIAYVDGFPIKKEDADRIHQLRRQMMGKGLPRSEMKIALKLERRKAEKAFAREKKKVCYNCRKSGHNLSECPDVGNQLAESSGTGICFKCGSTEHTHFECRVVRGQEFKFAQCFICNEQGHIARQCPDNARGLYPKGGACKVCGDVTHLKKDCPKFQAQQQQLGESVKLDTIAEEENPDILDKNENVAIRNFKRPNKIIKFSSEFYYDIEITWFTL